MIEQAQQALQNGIGWLPVSLFFLGLYLEYNGRRAAAAMTHAGIQPMPPHIMPPVRPETA